MRSGSVQEACVIWTAIQLWASPVISVPNAASSAEPPVMKNMSKPRKASSESSLLSISRSPVSWNRARLYHNIFPNACRVDFKSGIFVESKSGKLCAISGFANLQL